MNSRVRDTVLSTNNLFLSGRKINAGKKSFAFLAGDIFYSCRTPKVKSRCILKRSMSRNSLQQIDKGRIVALKREAAISRVL